MPLSWHGVRATKPLLVGIMPGSGRDRVTDGSCEFSVDGNLAHHMPKTAAPDHWPSLEALIYCRESHRCSEATRTRKHVFRRAFRCLCSSRPISRMAKVGFTSISSGCHEPLPGHEIDRWLIGPREGQRPSVGTGGIRENAGPLELCKACFRMWSSLCRRAEGIRDSRGGQCPALLMGSPE
jgi:hypothetical protein